ncbi:hypothetical protein HG441_001840 [Candidatus Saccharibacteria bacterium]|nr:hypothetical protein [Candidatus Saccharibacteria bacterium]
MNLQLNTIKENIFKIPELGIQFVLPEGLEYKIVEGKEKLDVIKYATFSVKNLTDLDRQKNGTNTSNCALERGVIGVLYFIKTATTDEAGYANTWIVRGGT